MGCRGIQFWKTLLGNFRGHIPRMAYLSWSSSNPPLFTKDGEQPTTKDWSRETANCRNTSGHSDPREGTQGPAPLPWLFRLWLEDHQAPGYGIFPSSGKVVSPVLTRVRRKLSQEKTVLFFLLNFKIKVAGGPPLSYELYQSQYNMSQFIS